MFQKIKLPLVISFIFLFFILLWYFLDLPSQDALVAMSKNYFDKYGFLTILIASLIEGMLVVGFYIPGGVVIFTGVILSAGDPSQAVFSVLATIIGFIFAYSFNYFLGKYGWYKLFVKFGLKDSLEEAKHKFENNGYKAIYMSYWQPNLASLISTCAGILKMNLYKFTLHSVLAVVLWSVFWGMSAYLLGEQVLSYLIYIFFAVMLVWIISIVVANLNDSK